MRNINTMTTLQKDYSAKIVIQPSYTQKSQQNIVDIITTMNNQKN